jgi:MoaA/NifB/PqqE/SkfB family radical SAM enzyme
MNGAARRSRIPPLGEIGWAHVKYNWLQPLVSRPFLPTTLVLYVTYRCNSRCIMCGIWQHRGWEDTTGELSAQELDRILADRLFADVRHLNINGGEPSLHGDLSDLVQVAADRLPRLQWITMSSNGLLPGRLIPLVERIRQVCIERNLLFSLGMSVHGLDEVSDRVFGTEGAFARQMESLAGLRDTAAGDGHHLSLHCVITAANVSHLPALHRWSREQGLPISFALGEVRDRFLNLEKADEVRIGADQVEPLIRFLRQLSGEKALLNPPAYRYHHLADMLEFGRERTMACHYALGGVILGSQGELYYCPHSRCLGECRTQAAYDIYYDPQNLGYRKAQLEQSECLRCPPYTFNRQEFAKDLLKYLRFVLSGQRGDQGR